MRSILTGSNYPQSLYAAILLRIRAERNITSLQAAFIKGYLVRNKKQEVSYMLDKDQKSIPYRLGRLFSLLEKTQQEAMGIATLRNRFFGSASSRPSVAFPPLLRLAQHHVAKIPIEFRTSVERRIQDIVSEINGFPARLSLQQQGEFFLGYYHQCHANYQKNNSEKE